MWLVMTNHVVHPACLYNWELRIGVLRVYYDVEETPEPVTFIRAIGVKRRNRVRIGRTEIEL